MKKEIKYFVVPLLMYLLAAPFSACSTPQNGHETHNGQKGNNSEHNSTAEMGFQKKYLREGFIDKDTFRIVIVSDGRQEAPDMSEIKNRAIKRARATLRKYIISKNRKYNNNVRAAIISMINENGSLHKKEIKKFDNDVYYFEIKSQNLKKHIKKISSKRDY